MEEVFQIFLKGLVKERSKRIIFSLVFRVGSTAWIGKNSPFEVSFVSITNKLIATQYNQDTEQMSLLFMVTS